MAELDTEIAQIVREWAEVTELTLKDRIRRLGIGRKSNSTELLNSVRHRVYVAAANVIGVDFMFLQEGRYIDMGVGRGYPLSGPTSRHVREGGRPRRWPRRWYSRPFYGRVNKLLEIISVQVTESIISEFAEIPTLTVNA